VVEHCATELRPQPLVNAVEREQGRHITGASSAFAIITMQQDNGVFPRLPADLCLFS
jgi:hypothetical protein